MADHRRGRCRLLLLLLAGLVLLPPAVSRSKGRRPPPGYQKASPLSAALLAPLAAVWMAGGIIDTFTGAIGWATGGIWDKVKELFRATTDWVTTWINHVIDWAAAAIDAVEGIARSAYDWATTISQWAVGTFDRLWDDIIGWASRAIGAARDFASGLVTQLGDWAEGAIGGLWDYATSIVDWVNDNVLSPLWDRITAAFDWVSDTVIPWFADRLADVGRWASGLVDWAVEVARGLVDNVVDWLQPLVGLIGEAWGWLEWIARHPFDWFTQTWRELGRLNPRTISDVVVDSVGRDTDRFENLIMDWFDR